MTDSYDNPRKRVLTKILHAHNRLLKGFTFVLYVAFLLIGFAQILLRYVFDQPVAWAEQLSRYMFAWSIFVGGALVMGTGVHITLDFLIENLSRSTRRKIALVMNGAAALLLAWLFVYDGIRILSVVQNQISPALGIRMTVPYLSVAAGGVLMLINAILLIGGAERESFEGDGGNDS